MYIEVHSPSPLYKQQVPRWLFPCACIPCKTCIEKVFVAKCQIQCSPTFLIRPIADGDTDSCGLTWWDLPTCYSWLVTKLLSLVQELLAFLRVLVRSVLCLISTNDTCSYTTSKIPDSVQTYFLTLVHYQQGYRLL